VVDTVCLADEEINVEALAPFANACGSDTIGRHGAIATVLLDRTTELSRWEPFAVPFGRFVVTADAVPEPCPPRLAAATLGVPFEPLVLVS